MKIISSSRPIAAIAIALTAVLTSCHSTSTKSAARQLNNASYAEVVSFNGAMNPTSRQFAAAGALPGEVRRTMMEYIKTGKIQNTDYARPQYYVVLDNACWAVCADTTGNMTGLFALNGRSSNGISSRSDARRLPATGSYKMIVNDTPQGPTMAYEIMKGLEPYDAYRKSVRARRGLSTPAPVAPPKPAAAAPSIPVMTPTARATTTTTTAPTPPQPAVENTESAVETESDAANNVDLDGGTTDPEPADNADEPVDDLGF